MCNLSLPLYRTLYSELHYQPSTECPITQTFLYI
nr:MAG TPA: hypothetical protein [Caudoviricetes sp.]